MKKPILVLLSFLAGLLIFPGMMFLYFLLGHPPVAVADAPFLFEEKIVRVPLGARIEREMPQRSPLDATEANLIAGAQIYRAQCASCHGLKDHPSKFGATMFPRTPQLWARHKNHPGVVGVSDDPVGETYWKVKNGIRLSGMPSYQTILSDDQMWQVSMLLAAAANPLPTTVLEPMSAPLP